MRVLIDLQACQSSSRLGGIGRYSLDLAKAMVQLAPQHDFCFLLNSLFPDHQEEIQAEFDGLVGPERFHVFQALGPTRSAEKANAGRRIASEYLRESVIREINPDLIHVASLVEGFGDDVVVSMHDPNINERTVITWYDLIPFVQPEMYLHDPVVAEHYYRKVGEARRASGFLAISEFTTNELIRELEVDPARVINIQAGVSAQFTPGSCNQVYAALRAKHRITKPYLIYTAGFDARKNQKGLIRAFSTLPREIREQYQLVIVGNAWDGIRRELTALGRSSGLSEDDLLITGHVSDEQLLEFYRHAHLFVFPSFFEGFGLPALEAMACGTPAIGSNCTSIPEVIGRKDALFDPSSDQSIASKIQEVLENSELYQELQEHGLRHAADFTWQRSAHRAIEFMEQLHQEREQSSVVRSTSEKDRPASFDQLVQDIARVAKEQKLSNFEIDCLAVCIEANERVVTGALSTQEQLDAIRSVDAPLRKRNRVGWITTWGTRCGIASYAAGLAKFAPLPPTVVLAEAQTSKNTTEQEDLGFPVVPCWNMGKDELKRLEAEVEKHQLDSLVIQFNFCFFDFESLKSFIARQIAAGRRVFAILHSTQDPPAGYKKKLSDLRKALAKCTRIMVHSRADVARLQALNLVANVSILPHAVHHCVANETKPVCRSEFTLSTYGFFLPNKGLLEVLQAFAQLSKEDKSLRLRMINASYSHDASEGLIRQAHKFCTDNRLQNCVELITDYLKDEESLELLASTDLVVFPYQQTGESSSAAVRCGLASGVPVAVTPLAIFDNVKHVVSHLPGSDIASIRDGLRSLIARIRAGDDNDLAAVKDAADLWRSFHDVRYAARQLANIIELSEARVA